MSLASMALVVPHEVVRLEHHHRRDVHGAAQENIDAFDAEKVTLSPEVLKKIDDVRP